MKKDMKSFFLCILPVLMVIILFQGCNPHQKDVDLSKINLDIKIDRFENDLFALNLDSISQQLPDIKRKYGEFFDIFSYEIIQIGDTAAPDYNDRLHAFLTDKIINEDYVSVMEKFPLLNDVEGQLTTAFKHCRYYFPEMPVPRVVSYVSGFNQSIVTADRLLGIGLDNYLGSDCEYYTQLGLNEYQKYIMYPAMIPVDCMQAWGQMEFPNTDSAGTLISSMLYAGKLMYFMKAMLPEKPDSMIIGYKSSQYTWCEKNEKQMWIYLIENKLLFSTDFMNINKFINNGPYTKDFSQESPGKAGVWIGWQIIKSYMQKNRDVTLQQLMQDNNSMEILRKSKYNP
jgi:gliding motility-associated lipoprotein GldB